MINLTFQQKRIGAAILLAMALFCFINWILKWDLLGDYDGVAFVIAVAAMFIYTFAVGPSKKEIEEHVKKKERPQEGG